VRHFLNGIEVSPRNADSIGITSDFTDDPDILKLNTDNIVLTREAYDIVKNHISTQGLFEGIPYSIEMGGNVTLDYYVDLLEQPTFNDHDVEIKIKQRKNWDNFVDKAKGTSWIYLLDKGVDFNVVEVPYLIVKDNQAEVAITTSLTIFSLYKTLAESIQDLQELISDATEAVSPNPSQVASSAIKIAARLAYIAVLYILILEFINQLRELLYPPVQYLKACNVIELFSKSCDYFGYTFQSSLLTQLANLHVLPIPLLRDGGSIFTNMIPSLLNNSWSSGVPSSSDSTPIVWTLFEQMEIMFNARTRIQNNVVQFERRDYWEDLVNQQLLPALVLQSERSDSFTYNTEEVWKRYLIHYQIDYSEIHTTDEIYEYSQSEFSTEPINFVNEDLITIKNLNDVNIGFSLGSRKNKLTFVENLALGLFTVVDLITDILTFGNGTNLSGTVTDRIGMLQVSSQFFSLTKLLYLVNARQPNNFQDFIGTKALWDNYHNINFITENSYEIRENARIRLRASEFVNLLDNNYAEIDGEICEILRIEFIDESGFATVTYKKPSDYALNKVTLITLNE
jgi:hypothetical protein